MPFEEWIFTSTQVVKLLRITHTGLMGLMKQCGITPVQRGEAGRGRVYLFTRDQYLAMKARRLERLNRMCRLAQEIEREP